MSTIPEPGVLGRTIAQGLFDDASLFPPAQAPMEAALGLHALARNGAWGLAQGRFLLPLGALGRLADERALLGDGSSLEVGLIVGSPADPTAAAPLDQVASAVKEATAADAAVRVVLLEHRPADPLAVAGPAAARATVEVARRLGDQVAAFVELVVAETPPNKVRDRVAALATVEEASAKVRCGGLEAGMVPTDESLAVFVHACVAHGLPFKGTAGLHHAFAVADGPRRRHGYVGLLLATLVALDGGDPRRCAAALMVRKEDVAVHDDALVTPFGTFDADAIVAARARFVAFGTCSFTEPLADLLELLGRQA